MHSVARPALPASARKLALAGVLIAAGAALAARGVFATFTSTASGGPQTVSTGTAVIALGATGAATNRLNVSASGLAPGDTIQRSADLSNTGTLNLASITLGLSASPSSALDSDATNGLQTTIQSCSLAWIELGPPYTYTCLGTTTTVLVSTPVSTLKATPATLSGLASLAPGSTDHLVVTLSLPITADNTFQNKTSTLTYTFTGTQRAATSQ